VEYVRLEWVWWFNHHRLLAPLDYLLSAEYEPQYPHPQVTPVPA